MQRNASVTLKKKMKTATAADAQWSALEGKTPAQIETWLASNVTTLAHARTLLARIIWAIKSLD